MDISRLFRTINLKNNMKPSILAKKLQISTIALRSRVFLVVLTAVFIFACASTHKTTQPILGVSSKSPIEFKGTISGFFDGERGYLYPTINRHIIRFLPHCEYRPNAEAIGIGQDGSFTFHGSEYVVRGYIGKYMSDNIMGKIPIIEVIYAEETTLTDSTEKPVRVEKGHWELVY